MPVPTRKPVLVLDSSKVNSVNVSFSLAPAKFYIDKYTLFISNEEGKLLKIHNVSKDYNTTLVIVLIDVGVKGTTIIHVTAFNIRSK